MCRTVGHSAVNCESFTHIGVAIRHATALDKRTKRKSRRGTKGAKKKGSLRRTLEDTYVHVLSSTSMDPWGLWLTLGTAREAPSLKSPPG
ncbi:hypothetical protein N7471_003102 [Penicillium samsonianum]|uniref:uncharacterized protein n=1 Tax=Penicillium samsonianum TaxID=1882272 RepID=UPI002549430B|nr:uncharacterized protein N7471_003102 [Penicillium samsonianum]KAJ6143649.1 hypothetical protein N7471_003102 [Penicillium samsonianum]